MKCIQFKRILNALTLALALASIEAVVHAEDAAAPKRQEVDLALFAPDTQWGINLGKEFPGAAGKFVLDKQDDKDTGALGFDFNGGGLYVVGTSNTMLAEGTTELRFKVKSKEPVKILIRIFDNTNQCHQWILPYTKTDEHELMRVSFRRPAPTYFGGKKDGKMYLPTKSLWIGVEKSGDIKEGTVLFTDAIAIVVK